MKYYMDVDDESESIAADLRAEVFASRLHSRKLTAHPDCRDPDHPGCERCEDVCEDADFIDETLHRR